MGEQRKQESGRRRRESVKLERVIVREVSLPLVHFFETSFGRIHGRRVLLVEVRADGLSGWGECVADDAPGFSYETVDTAWPVLSRFLVPRVLGVRFSRADEFPRRVRSVRGHPMAKAGLEAALWDLQAKAAGMPLWELLGGRHRPIPCGVSIGIQDHPDVLLSKIEQELEAGYQRIKIKIKPGWDVQIVAAVRKRFPRISLMVDANSAYNRSDFDHLAELDQFDLLMMEQPLEYDDVFRHVELQARLRTPICLDESIRHRRDADHAIAVGACRIVNIKMDAWADTPRPWRSTMSARPGASRSGAEGCWRPASGAPTTWRSPLWRTSLSPATSRPAAAISTGTRPGPPSKSTRTGPLPPPWTPGSATSPTSNGSITSPSAPKRSDPPETHGDRRLSSAIAIPS